MQRRVGFEAKARRGQLVNRPAAMARSAAATRIKTQTQRGRSRLTRPGSEGEPRPPLRAEAGRAAGAGSSGRCDRVLAGPDCEVRLAAASSLGSSPGGGGLGTSVGAGRGTERAEGVAA